jgi:hypothetical protein
LTIAIGLAYSVLFVVAFLLASHGPDPTADPGEITAFYANPGGRRVVTAGLYLMPFAGIAFIWFIVALRMWINAHANREDVLLSNIQLVTGILFTGLLFVAIAAVTTGTAVVEAAGAPVDPSVLRQMPLFGGAVFFVFAMRMAAMFVFTTTAIGRNARILPAWFGVLGYLVGLFLLLTATFNNAFAMVFPTWVALLCVLLAIRLRRIKDPNPPRPTGHDTGGAVTA